MSPIILKAPRLRLASFTRYSWETSHGSDHIYIYIYIRLHCVKCVWQNSLNTFYLYCVRIIFIQCGSTAKDLEVVPHLRTGHRSACQTTPGTQSSKWFGEWWTNLPQCVAEQLGGWLPFLVTSQVVEEHVRVVLHSVRLLKHSVNVVESVDVILDERVEGKLQFANKRQQNPGTSRERLHSPQTLTELDLQQTPVTLISGTDGYGKWINE